MGRTYQLIKNGKFSDEMDFGLNVSGYMYMGIIMHALGLPTDEHLGVHQAPHEVTGEKAEAIRKALNFAGQGPNYLKRRITFAIGTIENRKQYSLGTIEEDTEWVMEFLEMAKNPEGFASDYCDEYHKEE